MASYGDMQQQIAGELGYRADLLSPVAVLGSGYTGQTLNPVQKAIQRAIAKWERTRFYFNELYQANAFNTVAGQEFYSSSASSLIGTMPHLDKVTVQIANNRYPLEPRNWQYLEDTSVNPNVSGQPTDYAYYGQQLRFYPIPSGAYPIHLSGTQRLSALSATTDTNAWTQDAEALIIAQAKIYLYQDFLKPPNQSTLVQALYEQIYGTGGAPGALATLKGETTRRSARSRIRPTYF